MEAKGDSWLEECLIEGSIAEMNHRSYDRIFFRELATPFVREDGFVQP